MRPASTAGTRERLIEVAMELFRAQGYAATGLKQILRRAGVNPGSLYHFFRSKEDLLLAVLERYRERLGPELLEPAWAGVDDPLERVFALLDAYRQGLQDTGFAAGCPIGSLALELGALHPDAHARIAAHFQAWRDAVRRCLEQAGERLPAGLDRARLAALVLSTLEGGLMQARSYRSLEPLDDSLAMLRDYLDRLQAEAACERRSRTPEDVP